MMTPLFVVRRIIRSRGHAGFSLQNLMANIPLFQDFRNRLMCSYVSDTIFSRSFFLLFIFFLLFSHLFSFYLFISHAMHPSRPVSSQLPPPHPVLLHFPSEKSTLPRDSHWAWHNKLQQDCIIAVELQLKTLWVKRVHLPWLKCESTSQSMRTDCPLQRRRSCLCRTRAAQEPVPTRVIKPPFPPHFSVQGTAAVFDKKKPKISNF